MHDVFISYKRDDSALAMKVVNVLEASGIPCRNHFSEEEGGVYEPTT